MAGQLSLEERVNIEVLYLKGYSQGEIAKKTGRASGSVNNVITDFREGRGSEPEASDYVTEMVAIAKFVKEHKLLLSDFEERMEIAHIVDRSGFDKTGLLSLTTAMEGVDPSGVKEYVGTVKRLRKMENESNMTVDKIHDAVVKEMEDLDRTRNEISRLEEESEDVNERLIATKETYEKEKDEIDFSHKVGEILSGLSDKAVLSLLKELKGAGFEAQSLLRFGNDLKKIRENGQNLDRVILSMSVLLDLHSRGFTAEELDELDAELKGKGNKLKEVIDRALEWSKDRENLNRQNESLLDENRRLEERNEKLKSQIMEEETTKAKGKSDLENTDEEIRRLEIQRDGLKKEITKLRAEMTESEGKEEKTKNEITRLEEVFKTLDSSIVTFNDLKNNNAEMRKKLDEMTNEFNSKNEEIELSHALLGLLRGSKHWDKNDLTRVCKSISDGPSGISNLSGDLRKIAIDALVNLTDNSIVILYSQDKEELRAIFVEREEYEAEKEKWKDIERRNSELKGSLDQLIGDCIGTVESVMDAKSSDPIAQEFVKLEVGKIIEKRIEEEYQSLRSAKTASSLQKAAISIARSFYGKSVENLEPESFIRIVCIEGSGKTCQDILYFERILDALSNNWDVKGSSFVYSLCDVLRAMVIHYANNTDIPLVPIKKSGEIKIVRGGISPPIKRDVQNRSTK